MVDISSVSTAVRNTLAMSAISNVLWAWRQGQIDTDQSTRKIDAIVKEYREDIY